MGRWAHLDTDEERLPEGMTRVGYDADTQIYTYRDTDGSYWEGAPGAQYGKLYRVKSHRDTAPQLPSITIPNDVEGDEQPQILPDYDGDSIPKTPSLATTSRTTSPTHQVTTPQRVRLRRSHYQQRKSKRLPSLPGHGGEKSPALSRVTSATSGSVEYHDEKENAIPEAPELTPSHSHSNHSSDGDSIQNEKDFANANPVFTPHLHRQRRAQEREKKQEQAGLKRAGTISRIARFLSRGAGGSRKDKDADSMLGLRSGMSTRTAFSSTATGFGNVKWNRWPGLGGRIDEGREETDEEVRVEKEEVEGIPRRSTGAHGHRRTNSGMSSGSMPMPNTRGRAMTFDEILASDGRLRGVVSG